ncbi:MAG: leucyl/phenylalanyl-tRNA--protein transferase [Gammaproteobacteria bacterium]|nr:leucyl/phenylalanyl-tRNA--protein transferase [Gammaproteobacteria bacterium]
MEAFPPVSRALQEPDGLLAAGGDLSSARLLYAYRHGIFPWYDDGQPILWWSPDPRCVFLPGQYRTSRRFLREQRRSTFEIRLNTAFDNVIRACAAPRRTEQGTWITTDMIDAYEQLHRDGWAHSVEVWDDQNLVGGLYGLAVGQVFFGESMFSTVSGASKYALLFLSGCLQTGLLQLIDCQVISGHLLRLGATSMQRSEFVDQLQVAANPATRVENWPATPISCSRLLTE